jgi:hypothetical protein
VPYTIVVHSQNTVPNMVFWLKLCSWDLFETFWWVKKILVTYPRNHVNCAYLKKLSQFFSPKWPHKIFESNTNRLNLTWAFEWCINYDCNTNYFFLRFFGIDSILGKKLTKIISRPNMIIHAPFESPCQI